MYCTLSPCYLCLKIIASAGIKEVYYETAYESKYELTKKGKLTKKSELTRARDHFWENAAVEAGIKVKQIEILDVVARKQVEDKGEKGCYKKEGQVARAAFEGEEDLTRREPIDDGQDRRQVRALDESLNVCLRLQRL